MMRDRPNRQLGWRRRHATYWPPEDPEARADDARRRADLSDKERFQAELARLEHVEPWPLEAPVTVDQLVEDCEECDGTGSHLGPGLDDATELLLDAGDADLRHDAEQAAEMAGYTKTEDGDWVYYSDGGCRRCDQGSVPALPIDMQPAHWLYEVVSEVAMRVAMATVVAEGDREAWDRGLRLVSEMLDSLPLLPAGAWWPDEVLGEVEDDPFLAGYADQIAAAVRLARQGQSVDSSAGAGGGMTLAEYIRRHDTEWPGYGADALSLLRVVESAPVAAHGLADSDSWCRHAFGWPIRDSTIFSAKGLGERTLVCPVCGGLVHEAVSADDMQQMGEADPDPF